MKQKLLTLILVLTVLLFIGINCSRAQGTAFTYQGQLQNGGVPVSGNFDFTFSLFNNPGTNTGQLGATLPIPGVGVTNGLFTVTLDFGPVFNGGSTWLAIAVRTNGAANFIPLTPLQPLSPTPYAIYSPNAGTAASASSVPLSALPPAVVTNGATGVNITGTFTGNGNGLTNVPGTLTQIVVQTTNLTAQPNTSYDITNATLTTVTLPASANVGDVIQINGTGIGGWQAVNPSFPYVWTLQMQSPSAQWAHVVSSADGTHLAAAIYNGPIYTSTNAGLTWTEQTSAPTSASWNTLASSSDGLHLVASVLDAQLYTSADGGTTWVQQNNAPNGANYIVSSSDGSHLVVTGAGSIYSSADGGVTWSASNNSPANVTLFNLASSADCTHLLSAPFVGSIYTSANTGVTWTEQTNAPTNAYWQALLSSSNGTHLIAVSGLAYTSADAGVTWIPQANTPSNVSWVTFAGSSDCSHIVGAGYLGPIYTSANGGATWTEQLSVPTNGYWTSVASSADATHLVAALYGNQIYTATASISGAPGTSESFQYLGNGVWQPLPPPGNFTNLIVAGNVGIGTNAAGSPLVVSGSSSTNVSIHDGVIDAVQTGGTFNGGAIYGSSLLGGGAGVIGEADVTGSGNAFPAGVWGISKASNGVGVLAEADSPAGLAGQFLGNMQVIGAGSGPALAISTSSSTGVTSNSTAKLSLSAWDAHNWTIQSVGNFSGAAAAKIVGTLQFIDGTTGVTNLTLTPGGSNLFRGQVGIGIGASPTTIYPQEALYLTSTNTIGAIIGMNGETTGGHYYELVSAGTGAATTAGSFGIFDFDQDRYVLSINASGNVGIGTTTPTAPLTVVGTNSFPHVAVVAASNAPFGAFLSIDATSTTNGKDYLIFATGSKASEGQGKLVFKNQSDGVYPLCLTSNGNVGIGTLSPASPLTVKEASNDPSGICISAISLVPAGNGVMGEADANSGASFTNGSWGVWGRSAATNGAGVTGVAFASSGTNIGVFGVSFSPQGYGGYFAGQGYFSGNLGLGTANPDRPLAITGTGMNGEWISLQDTNGMTRWHINNTGGGLNFVQTGQADERLYLSPNGGVGIGTEFPDALLTVNGTADKPGGGSWATFSDARLKDLGASFTHGLDDLDAIQPIHYHYKANNPLNLPTNEYVGVVAQQVQKTIPEAVQSTKDGYLTVNNDPIIWTMLNAIKELKARDEQLKTQDDELKAQNAELKQRLERLEATVATGRHD